MTRYEKYSFMPIDQYRKTWFVGLPLRWKAFVRSYKARHEIHLMDDVIYHSLGGDIKCFVNNGTRYNGQGVHLWDVCPYKLNEDGKRLPYYVSDEELTKVKNWFNFKNDRLYLYKWYMHSWYIIDLHKKIKGGL